jgi:hypothetical protein
MIGPVLAGTVVGMQPRTAAAPRFVRGAADRAAWAELRAVAPFLPVALLAAALALLWLGPARAESPDGGPTTDALVVTLAFASAVNAGDTGMAVALLAPDALYQGLLVCDPAPCVGRDAILPVLAYEADDRTHHTLHAGTARTGAGWVRLRGETRSASLAGAGRLIVEVRASADARGINDLRFVPDAEDGATGRVLADLRRASASLED